MGNDSLYVLLADDDLDDCLFFKDALEEINAEIVVSFEHDGSKLMYFLTQPQNRLPNIIFIDINMPIKNGIECLKEIRANKRFNGLILVIYSTSDSEHDIHEAFVHGANIYIKKPNNFLDLKASLANAISRSVHTIH